MIRSARAGEKVTLSVFLTLRGGWVEYQNASKKQNPKTAGAKTAPTVNELFNIWFGQDNVISSHTGQFPRMISALLRRLYP